MIIILLNVQWVCPVRQKLVVELKKLEMKVIRTNLNELNYMSAALEIFAAIVTLVLLVGCLLERKLRTKSGKLFVWCLFVNIAMLLVDAPIWILLANPRSENVTLVKFLSLFSDTFLCSLISLYAYCLTEYINERKKISYRYAGFITALCGIAVLLLLVNAFNGMYIYYDENGLDQTGPLYLMSQAFNVVLPAMTMALALRNHDALGWADTLIWVLYGAIPVLSIPFQIFWAVTPVYLAMTVSFVLINTLIHVEQVKRAADVEKALVQKELALSESNNSLVLSQTQPHFLYNALTSIYRLCDVKPEAAKEAVSNFSKYLRGNLDSIKQTKMISFADELKHLEAYLYLEKIRYGDYLEVRFDIKVTEFFIPPLTVQPLVENAVNHGISDLPDGGCVKISTHEEPDCYEIQVSDNGVGFDIDAKLLDERLHIGIANVRSRLKIMCNGTLDIFSAAESGTKAIIRIPKGGASDEHHCG